jgi:hypothetical protein
MRLVHSPLYQDRNSDGRDRFLERFGRNQAFEYHTYGLLKQEGLNYSRFLNRREVINLASPEPSSKSVS